MDPLPEKMTSLPRSLALSCALTAAVLAHGTMAAVRAHRMAHEQELMAEYREFVAIPNVGADQPNARRNAEFIIAMLKRRGIAAELLEGKTSATNPAVFAEIKVPGVRYVTISGEAPTARLALATRRDERSPIVRNFLAQAFATQKSFAGNDQLAE